MTVSMRVSRTDFPYLAQHDEVSYLDSAATTLLPAQVITAMETHMRTGYGPVHRGLYPLSLAATDLYEATRAELAQFLGADATYDTIFTSGGTAALALGAWIARWTMKKSGTIVLVGSSHHSMVLPLQRLAAELGYTIRWVSVPATGGIDPATLTEAVTDDTVMVAAPLVSNVTGEVLDVSLLREVTRTHGALLFLDAAQASGRIVQKVAAWDVDLLAGSAHKMYGPPGVGWLCVKKDLAAHVSPLVPGGGAVAAVSQDHVSWLPSPARFEAGTPNLVGVAGLRAALSFMKELDVTQLALHEQALTESLVTALGSLPDVTVFGPTESQAGVVSFRIGMLHSHDVADILGHDGVAVRAGQLCAEPLLRMWGVSQVVRASVGVYTEQRDIDRLITSLKRVQRVFAQRPEKVVTVASS